MDRRDFLKKCAAVGASGFILSNRSLEVHIGIKRPNIILMLVDDMGWGDCSINNPESKIPMPNLEKLASEGMNFKFAYSSAAVCAPTRYTIMTGNYTWRGTKVGGTWMFWQPPQIPEGQKTLGSVLQNAGYRTAMFGKLHLGGNFYKIGSDEIAQKPEEVDFSRRFRRGPLNYGFDYSFLTLSGIQNQPYAYFENDLLVGDPADMITWEAGTYGNSKINKTGLGMPYWDSSEVGPTLTQKAIDFIDETHRKNLKEATHTPFFVYYSSPAAHGPHTPPETFLGEPVKGVTGMSDRADMIYELDVALGKLTEALEERDLVRDTLIIFTSDNGGTTGDREEFGHDAVGGLRGAKGKSWEGGFRVPFVAKWADKATGRWDIPPGTTRHQVIGVIDIMATFAGLTGQSLGPEQARDSYNMLGVLLGERGDERPVRQIFLIERGSGQRVVREGTWKLILNPEGTEPLELYNLAEDPTETTNLLGKPGHGLRVKRMSESWVWAWNSSRTAPVLRY